MAIVVQCPNPACRASCSVAEAHGGKAVRCARCGKPFAVKPTLDGHLRETKASLPSSNGDPFAALPSLFGRYRVLRLLGKGGMGAVYLAEDSQLGRQVALKMPFASALESPQRVERFVREARSAAVLHHPNICTVYDAGQIDGRPFLTMAYITGKPVADAIDADVPMDPRRVVEIARKVALALEHAHKKGIVHRDLKPANVMLAAEDGEPVVMDFGLARRLAEGDEARLTSDGGILGTPGYMSPEQVKGDGQAIGPATDVYSLGVMLFEMLTGRMPYAGSTGVVMARILAAPVPPLREFRPDVDSRLDALCRKAMAKKPASRFQSMAEFAAALQQCSTAPSDSHSPGPVAASSPFQDLAEPAAVPRASKKRRAKPAGVRRPYLAIAVGLVAVALAGLLAAVLFRVKTPEGVLVVQVDEPGAEVFVDGARVKVTWDRSGKKAEIRIKPGAHKLEVKKDGVTVLGEEVNLAEGGRQVLTAKLEKPAPAEKPAERPDKVDRDGKDDPPPPPKRELVKLPGEGTEEFEYVFEGEKKKGSCQVLVLDIGGGETMELVRIPKGVFMMGSQDREGEGNEMPQRRIEISRDFYLGKYEVTQAQYRAVTGKSPSHFKGDRLPVEQVPWPDAMKFCEAVSEWTKRKVNLPTEAEHEYACRAGTRTPYHFGSKLNGDLANCDGSRPFGTDVKGVNKNTTVAVGSYPPNAWGLYDMEGNVWEWCQDRHGSYDQIEGSKDPVQLKLTPAGRSFRGGSWLNPAWLCRAACRSWGSPEVPHPAVGFRVCLRLE